MKKHYSIFISSNDAKDSSKEYHISYNKLKIIFCLFGAAVLLLLVFFTDYLFNFHTHTNYQKLKVENQQLKQNLSHIRKQFRLVDSQLNQISDFSEKIKILAGLSEHNPDRGASAVLPIGPLPLFQPHAVNHAHFIPKNLHKRKLPLEKPSAGSKSSEQIIAKKITEKSRHLHEDLSILLEQMYEQMDILSHTPKILPAKGWISSYFGYRPNPFTGQITMHEGIDIATAPGTPIYAPANGTVVYVGYDGRYGKKIVVDHGFKMETIYGHLSEILVHKFQKVKLWDVIGVTGNSGMSTGPHLHYEVRLAKVPVDPENYFVPDQLVLAR